LFGNKIFTIFKKLKKDMTKILDSPTKKILISKDYNFYFDKKTGFFARWGETKEDDGDLEKGLPEIADIEISTVCHGVGNHCKICYKANTGTGDNMSLETFEKVLDSLPLSVTQIAIGIGDLPQHKYYRKIKP